MKNLVNKFENLTHCENVMHKKIHKKNILWGNLILYGWNYTYNVIHYCYKSE